MSTIEYASLQEVRENVLPAFLQQWNGIRTTPGVQPDLNMLAGALAVAANGYIEQTQDPKKGVSADVLLHVLVEHIQKDAGMFHTPPTSEVLRYFTYDEATSSRRFERLGRASLDAFTQWEERRQFDPQEVNTLYKSMTIIGPRENSTLVPTDSLIDAINNMTAIMERTNQHLHNINSHIKQVYDEHLINNYGPSFPKDGTFLRRLDEFGFKVAQYLGFFNNEHALGENKTIIREDPHRLINNGGGGRGVVNDTRRDPREGPQRFGGLLNND